MPNTTYIDKTTVVTTPSVQDFNNAAYGPSGHPFWGGSAGGTANALTITTTIVPSALASGQVYRCKVTLANNAAVTVNANALGAKALVGRGSIALVANVLQINDIIEFIYDLAADNFQLIGVGPATNYDIASLPNVSSLPNVYSGSVFRKTVVINGAMRIAQRGTSFAAVATNIYILDHWFYNKVGTMVHTITQDTDVPTVVQAGILFTNSLRLNLTTADTAIAATDVATINQPIEGYNFQRIAQRAFSMSFWVKATTAGVYSISFRNAGLDRSYVSNFTISAGSTWEYKTIAVSASPSAGTWNYTNGAGMYMAIVLAAGSSFQTTAGAWQAGSFHSTTSNINGVNTGATDFRITGVQIEPSAIATEYEMLNIEDEISACQRYYWKSFPYATAPAQGVGSAGAINYRTAVGGVVSQNRTINFPVLMRSAPTVVTYNTVVANANWRNVTLALDSGVPTLAAGAGSDAQLEISNPQVAGDAAGNFIAIHATADAEL